MKKLPDLKDFISSEIIDEIDTQISRMIAIEVSQSNCSKGTPIQDNQGIAIIAADSGKTPLVFAIGVPVPLSVNDGKLLLREWEICQKNLDFRPWSDVAFFNSCVEMLNHFSDEPHFIMKINYCVGAYSVYRLKKYGIDIKAQAKINRNYASNGILHSYFYLITRQQSLLHFHHEIGFRIALRKST